MNTDYRLLQYGVFDSSVKFPGLQTTRERLLDSFEIELYTDDCPGVAYLEGASYALERGLLLCGKPGQRRHSRLPFKCCYLHIADAGEPLAAALRALPDVCHITGWETLAEHFYKMAPRGSKTLADALFLRSCADRILYFLLESQRQLPPAAPILPHAGRIRVIEDYIRAHCAEPLDLASLAERACLSPVYFHRIFTACTGVTPAQYVTAVRMDEAKRLLISTDRPISEIAERCGFSSQAYFADRFKAETGLSPLRYRKRLLSRLEP